MAEWTTEPQRAGLSCTIPVSPCAMQCPPKEELVSMHAKLKVVSFDMETTGLEPDDQIVQLGAYVPDATFSQYVLPSAKQMHPEAAQKTGLEVKIHEGRRMLMDTRLGAPLATISEPQALSLFLQWLQEQTSGWNGVILLSHGAIFLDVPQLIAAVQYHNMADQFFQVVHGFCDSNAIFQESSTFQNYRLDVLYRNIVGKHRHTQHRAEGDARTLYDMLLVYTKCSSLTLDIPILGRYTYTTNCMKQYVIWRSWCDSRWNNLSPIATLIHRRTHSNKKKNVFLRNLVSVGYDYHTLETAFQLRPSDRDFVTALETRVADFKCEYESYLTDTAGVRAREVAGVVLDYFYSLLPSQHYINL